MGTLFSVIATKKYSGSSEITDSRTFSTLMDAIEFAKEFKKLGWNVDVFVMEGDMNFEIMMD